MDKNDNSRLREITLAASAGVGRSDELEDKTSSLASGSRSLILKIARMLRLWGIKASTCRDIKGNEASCSPLHGQPLDAERATARCSEVEIRCSFWAFELTACSLIGCVLTSVSDALQHDPCQTNPHAA